MVGPTSPREARFAPGLAAPPPPDLLTLVASPAPHPDALSAALAALPAEAVPGLLARLAFHRVDGLAHRTIARLAPGARVDPWLRASLRRRHQRLAAATLAQGLALAEILEALERAGIPAVVLRGLHCAETIYGDPGARPFEDHDLMVRPADAEGARRALRRLGFEQRTPGLLRRGGVILDLHTDPLGACRRPTRADLFPLPIEALFDRARPGTIAGGPALLLEPEDDLLLLAIHLVKHSFDRLIRIADLAHLLWRRGGTLSWETVRRRAEASNTRRLLAWALESATLLGAAVPDGLRPSEAGDSLEAVLLRRVMALRPLPYTGELLMTLAAPSLRDRLRFLWDALLPPGESPEGPWGRASAIPARGATLLREAARQLHERRRAR
jgi:hypothetical protein